MKKIAAAALFCCILFGSLSAFGIEQGKMIEEAYYYTAKLFYCDPTRSKIVLTDVKPTGESDEVKTRTASEAEYNEICLSGSGRFTDGVVIPPDDFNRYADSNVGVVITRSAAGEIRVVALKFL